MFFAVNIICPYVDCTFNRQIVYTCAKSQELSQCTKNPSPELSVSEELNMEYYCNSYSKIIDIKLLSEIKEVKSLVK